MKNKKFLDLFRNLSIKLKRKIVLDTFLLLIIGALSSLSLPPLNFFFINFFTFSTFFIFLFKNLNYSNKKIFFFYGWLFGFGYFLTNIYWITISLTFDQDFNFLIPIALIFIPAFLALFYGIVTLIFYIFNFKNMTSSFFLFSLLFGFVEYIRGNILTGFPWNLIVYSFTDNVEFLSFLSVIGTYSLNLLVISFFAAPAIYIFRQSKKEIIVSISLLLLFPVFLLIYNVSYKNLFLSKELRENPYIIRVISSNINLDRFYKNIDTENVINELINLSSPDPEKKIFFLWPEGIIPDTYQDELDLYSDLFKKNFTKNHLVGLGIINRLAKEKEYKFFNSFSIFDNNLNLLNNYNKVNLVPFGEFLPFENFLNKFGLKTITNNFNSFTAGDKRNTIQFKNEFKGLSFLPLICYEIIYSGKLTKNFNFDYILNISEDGWFGNSVGPKQHFAHSIFRAIENGKYVIRSSNNGMGAIINPLGEIEKKIDYGKDGYIDFTSRRDMELTIFSKYGNKIFLILILLYIFLIFSFNRITND